MQAEEFVFAQATEDHHGEVTLQMIDASEVKMNMIRKHTLVKVISLAAMVGLLAMAYGRDRWLELQKRIATQTFNPMPGMWLSVVANLLIAGSLLGLSWLLIFKGDRSRLVTMIYLIVGLFLTLYRTYYTFSPFTIRATETVSLFDA